MVRGSLRGVSQKGVLRSALLLPHHGSWLVAVAALNEGHGDAADESRSAQLASSVARARMARMSAAISRRPAIASAL
jgi:hypothetical protein